MSMYCPRCGEPLTGKERRCRHCKQPVGHQRLYSVLMVITIVGSLTAILCSLMPWFQLSDVLLSMNSNGENAGTPEQPILFSASYAPWQFFDLMATLSAHGLEGGAAIGMLGIFWLIAVVILIVGIGYYMRSHYSNRRLLLFGLVVLCAVAFFFAFAGNNTVVGNLSGSIYLTNQQVLFMPMLCALSSLIAFGSTFYAQWLTTKFKS